MEVKGGVGIGCLGQNNTDQSEELQVRLGKPRASGSLWSAAWSSRVVPSTLCPGKLGGDPRWASFHGRRHSEAEGTLEAIALSVPLGLRRPFELLCSLTSGFCFLPHPYVGRESGHTLGGLRAPGPTPVTQNLRSRFYSQEKRV